MNAASGAIAGIIGGMGPEATVELLRRVVARTPARDDDEHLHWLVECNPRIPSRLAHLLERSGPDPTPELVRIARNLQAGGATFLAMPCNTAHHYAPAIAAAVTIPLLDMVQLAVAQARATGAGQRIGLLASSAVHDTALYSNALAAHGLQGVVPRRQDEVMALIRAVKQGDAGAAPRQALAAIATDLARDCDVLLVACTELSVIATALPSQPPVVDALDELAAAIVAAATQR
ncbi:MAG: amino acid racemase [Pseudomonadota bacterium]